jgi:signal transduction histidine kinase
VPADVVLRDLDVSIRQVKSLSALVGALLDVSRIAQGRLTLALEELDLVAVAREVASSLGQQAARMGSSIVLEGARQVVGTWDRLRIEQVITNLMTNAIKYGAGKPITLRVSEDAGQAVLRVEDQGIGISPENVARIFGRFERGVSDRHYGGMGLGLYIARQIVDALGGHIEVASAPGLGATFTVLLPTQPQAAPTLGT